MRPVFAQLYPPWKDSPPIIITLDGVTEVIRQCTPFRENPPPREGNYLATNLAAQWELDPTSDLRPVEWSGLPEIGDTYTNFIESTREEILSAYKTGRPVVIVAHSWGTVVAFKLLTDDLASILPAGAIDQLITLGSPLAKGWCIAAVGTKLCFRGDIWGQEYVTTTRLKKPPTVRHWTNFWTALDMISGPNSDADENVNVRLNTPYQCSDEVIAQRACPTLHSAYFRDRRLAQQISWHLADDCKENATSERPVTSGYGAGYDVFHSGTDKESVVQVACSDTGAALRVGSGWTGGSEPIDHKLQYVYRVGYVYNSPADPPAWQVVNLVGDGELIGGNWYVGSASAPVNCGLFEPTRDTFVIGYVCTYNPNDSFANLSGQWKCGCSSRDCRGSHASKWQLQIVRSSETAALLALTR